MTQALLNQALNQKNKFFLVLFLTSVFLFNLAYAENINSPAEKQSDAEIKNPVGDSALQNQPSNLEKTTQSPSAALLEDQLINYQNYQIPLPDLVPKSRAPNSKQIKAEALRDEEIWCANRKFYHERILREVLANNEPAIQNLPQCFKQDRALMIKITLLRPNYFKNASEFLKKDESFLFRILNISPQTLEYSDLSLRSDSKFMKKAIMNNREALRYAAPELLDNFEFMRQMINIDSENYKFASPRIKSLNEIAKSAFEDNGLMLQYAPKEVLSNFELVKIAVNSNRTALAYASKSLQYDTELRLLASSGQLNDEIRETPGRNQENQENPLEDPKFSDSEHETKTRPNLLAQEVFNNELLKFLKQNYLENSKSKNLGQKISNRGRYFGQNLLVYQEFASKWQRSLNFERISKDDYREDWRLKPNNKRNSPINWRQDFAKTPDLIERIEDFFRKHELQSESLNNLKTTYFWKIKAQPLTFAFNIYLLRESSDADLGPNFANITSLTAIAQKEDSGSQGKWHLSVIEAIFDKEIKVDTIYTGGHRRYFLWDILPSNFSAINQLQPKKFEELLFVIKEIQSTKNQVCRGLDCIEGDLKISYPSKNSSNLTEKTAEKTQFSKLKKGKSKKGKKGKKSKKKNRKSKKLRKQTDNHQNLELLNKDRSISSSEIDSNQTKNLIGFNPSKAKSEKPFSDNGKNQKTDTISEPQANSKSESKSEISTIKVLKSPSTFASVRNFGNRSKNDLENQQPQWLKQILFRTNLNPRVIFLVEDEVEQHFEIFEEQKNGKYRLVYSSPSLPSLIALD